MLSICPTLTSSSCCHLMHPLQVIKPFQSTAFYHHHNATIDSFYLNGHTIHSVHIACTWSRFDLLSLSFINGSNDFYPLPPTEICLWPCLPCLYRIEAVHLFYYSSIQPDCILLLTLSFYGIYMDLKCLLLNILLNRHHLIFTHILHAASAS